MDQQQQSRWRPTRRQVLWASAAVALFIVAILISYRYGITLWDWIKLLIVPAVIAGGGLWFNAQQREREQRIANDRAKDETLQAYLDHMSQLLTDKEQPLRRAKPQDNLAAVARARTLTVLSILDGSRKGSLLEFLYEARLINRDRLVLSLRGANLEGAHLQGADLRKADLTRANLQGADLQRAKLEEATLEEADLQDANLQHAHLERTRLLGADLRRAKLTDTDLPGTDLVNADLEQANLGGARLTGAYLQGAYLQGADLSGAYFSGVNLGGADLSRANLKVASGTNSYGAELTNEELEREASSLEGAIMPNGQKYEDWLKSKGSEENGEDGGPS